MPLRWLAPAGLAAAALVVAACGSSPASGTGAASSAPPASSAPASSSSGTMIKTTTISGTAVLTNSQGFTLYWFAPDTPTTSKCNGSCASFWPPYAGAAKLPGLRPLPVTGEPPAGPGFGLAERAEEPRTRSVTSLAAWVRQVTGDGTS